jgi:hypothetical protein
LATLKLSASVSDEFGGLNRVAHYTTLNFSSNPPKSRHKFRVLITNLSRKLMQRRKQLNTVLLNRPTVRPASFSFSRSRLGRSLPLRGSTLLTSLNAPAESLADGLPGVQEHLLNELERVLRLEAHSITLKTSRQGRTGKRADP